MVDVVVPVTFADLTETGNLGGTISNPGGTILRITPTFFGAPFFEYSASVYWDADSALFAPYQAQYAKRIRMTWRANAAGPLTPSVGNTVVFVAHGINHDQLPFAPNDSPFFQQGWSAAPGFSQPASLPVNVVNEELWETGDAVTNLGLIGSFGIFLGISDSAVNYTYDLLSLEYTFDVPPEFFWTNKLGTQEFA